MTGRLTTLLLNFAILLACPLIHADEAKFLVGAATADVTPKEPLPMWGYGSRHDQLSTGVIDALKAKTIVIQAGEDKLAIVGLDLGRAPGEETLQHIRQRILDSAGIKHSFIAGSHTHHGPVLELTNRPERGQGKFDAALRYYQQLEDVIVAAILEADKNLAPAKIATGAVELDGFNRNRHSKIQPIPLDRTLGVIRLDNADTGKTIAILANFTAHPTSIPEEKHEFSADYPGTLREELETNLGGVAVFMQGASGDLSTNRGPHGDYAQYGRALGKEAVKLAQSLQPKSVEKPSIKVLEDRFTFKPRVDLGNPLIRSMYGTAFFPELVNNFMDEYAEGVRPRLTVAVLNGQIALVGGSGEFFCQHAIRLRERARTKQTFFFGYCNGYHQYFPTVEGAAEGGYGADSQVAIAEVGSGEYLANKALEWIFKLQGARL